MSAFRKHESLETALQNPPTDTFRMHSLPPMLPMSSTVDGPFGSCFKSTEPTPFPRQINVLKGQKNALPQNGLRWLLLSRALARLSAQFLAA